MRCLKYQNKYCYIWILSTMYKYHFINNFSATFYWNLIHLLMYHALIWVLGITRRADGTPTTEVTPVTIWQIHTPDLGHQMVMVMVMNDLLPPLLCNVNRPSHSEIQLFQNLTMKIHGQGHVCGPRSRSRLTFKIQRSRLRSRSNPLVTFEAWSSIDMFVFRFMAIRPFLAEI